MLVLDESDCHNAGLYDTPLYQRLSVEGITLADVGSRGGSKGYLAPFRKACNFVGFDADAAVAQTEPEPGWKSYTVLPACLWSSEEKVKLYITKSPVNCSLYPPAKHLVEQYHLNGFAVERIEELQATTLDKAAGKLPHLPEVIKTDAQGADLDILKGADRILRESAQVIISEILFIPVYEGIPLFSDVETWLRGRDFWFYGFIEQTFRSTRRLAKGDALQRERFFHADGVFFRRLTPGHPIRAFDVQWLLAVALHYYDYALELVDLAPYADAEKTRLRKVTNDLAHLLANRLRETAAKLGVDAGFRDIVRVGDVLKDFTTFADIP